MTGIESMTKTKVRYWNLELFNLCDYSGLIFFYFLSIGKWGGGETPPKKIYEKHFETITVRNLKRKFLPTQGLMF